jgi:SAM-dependent methyltransferase
MDKSILVRWFGFPATLIHGDTLVLDRWLWLCRYLPVTRNRERLLDVGCGTGAFTIGAARRGYRTVGLSWDERNQTVALERARACGIRDIEFPIQDVRQLDQRKDLIDQFDFVLCLENIEHILDDRKLMRDMACCLKPGGRLLLTTPNYYYRAIKGENGPFSTEETGGHVRRGYSVAVLQELCRHANLEVEEINSCSGFLSQKVTALWRSVTVSLVVRFALTLPIRLLPPIFDPLISKLTNWPNYSICLIAYKPRWSRDS